MKQVEKSIEITFQSKDLLGTSPDIVKVCNSYIDPENKYTLTITNKFDFKKKSIASNWLILDNGDKLSKTWMYAGYHDKFKQGKVAGAVNRLIQYLASKDIDIDNNLLDSFRDAAMFIQDETLNEYSRYNKAKINIIEQ